MSSPVARPRRPRWARAAVAAALVGLGLQGCQLSRWGRPAFDPDYSSDRELWELPLGAVLLPVAVPLDLTFSLLTSVGIGLLNPLNWVLIPLDRTIVAPTLYALPTTATALTLINPRYNAAWSVDAPEGMIGVLDEGDWGEDEGGEEPGPDAAEGSRAEGERREFFRRQIEQAEREERYRREQEADRYRRLQEGRRERD